MRVGHFIETGVPGGAEKLILEICPCLGAAGVTPVIIHFDHPFFREKCNQLDIEQCTAPAHELFKKTRALPLFAMQFSRFLKELKIDLLHSHLFGPVTGAALACRLAGIPGVGTLHDVHMIEEKPVRIRLIEAAGLAGTELVVVSKTMERFYRERMHFAAGRLRTIYNGVRLPESIPAEMRRAKRSLFNVGEDDTLFISVGRLVQLKRYDNLVSAFSLLDREKSFKLLIVGDGPEEENIKSQIRRNDLQDRIIMTGRRQDVDSLLLASDCYVQCSDTEGLSMSIMEAMACELPCLVTDVGGNSELVHDSINGVIVPAEPHGIAVHVQKMLEDPGLRKAMGEESRKMVKDKFLLETTVKQYVELYNQLQ